MVNTIITTAIYLFDYCFIDKRGGRGGTFQLYCIIWRKKDENGKGKKVGVSIGFTSFGNVQSAAATIWSNINAKPGTTRWVDHCACRDKLALGWYFDPNESFSLNIYAHDEVVAAQLKWFIRLELDSVTIFATKESKIFLNKYTTQIKKQLEPFLGRMDNETRDKVRAKWNVVKQ